MRQIRKLTIDYSLREDRLRATTLLKDGDGLVMWLTQKLTSRLVKGLVELFDNTLAVPETPPAAQAAAQPVRERRVAAHFWEQARADLSRVPQRPVPPPRESTPEVLVDGLRLRQHKDTYFLHFSWGEEAVFLPADETWLRQFMRSLHTLYRDAEWPVSGLWPVWFDAVEHKHYVRQSEIN
ncbi:MAG: hypothetical protein M0R03_16080 [Novosphingobium sp.]|nr:hypothetical protein [Novosphingobium sp.]